MGNKYRIIKVVICQGCLNKVPYIHHILVQSEDGELIVIAKVSYTKEFIKIVSCLVHSKGLIIVRLARRLGDFYGCTEMIPYIEPRKVNHARIAKVYNASLADIGKVREIAKDIKQYVWNRSNGEW